MATKKTKAVGTAVLIDLAINALRNPTVQHALRQAPSVVGRLRSDMLQRRELQPRQGKRTRVTARFGQRRLELRAANLRALIRDLETMPAGKRIDAATIDKVNDALDAIDLELRIAAQQDFADRRRLHKRIDAALRALVDALIESESPRPPSGALPEGA